jgi:hypothetical protein
VLEEEVVVVVGGRVNSKEGYTIGLLYIFDFIGFLVCAIEKLSDSLNERC